MSKPLSPTEIWMRKTDFDVENISIKLQHDACNCWGVNMFTRQPDLKQVWKFKKVTQRSKSKLSKILRWRKLLSRYNLIKAIYEELSYSQGPPRCCLLESLKRSHKGQHQNWLKFWWVEHHFLYSYNMMQANSDAFSYSQGLQEAAIWTWPNSKDLTKVNIELVRDFDVEKISVKYWQFLQSNRVHKAAWP